LLLVIALAFALAPQANAQNNERSIRIRTFSSLLTVHPDGALDVVEQITIHFTGEWHGINRDISLRHNTASGRATKLDFELIGITDDAGNALDVDRSDSDGGRTQSFKIWIPGAVDADKSVIIRYRVRSPIRYFQAKGGRPAFDELYWNVTGNEWTMPIDSVHARVVLPDGIAPTQMAVYTGRAGSQGHDAVVQRDGNEVDFATDRGLFASEGMTVAVGWPAGYIAGRPGRMHEALLDLVRWSPIVLPFLVFVLAYRRWEEKGRDPEEEAIAVMYEPLHGMSPAELGTLVDNSADMQDVTATLVDLAVRGYLHITELTQEHLLGLVKNTDYQIDIRHQANERQGLKPHEIAYIDALEQSAPLDDYSMKVSDLRNKFYRFLPRIKDAIYDSLVEVGYYVERPDSAKAKGVGFSVLGIVVLGGLSVLVFNGTINWLNPVVTIVAAGISTVILITFGALMPARTVAGARAREATLGFKEFLSRVEEERYKKMITSPELFEKYLPYALAFGVADKWANAFKDIYREPPQWYSGGAGPFNAASFSQSISSFSTAASSSMGSSPSSSGSGGGGSSGGGSGGGGGSGF
jgi:predicted membrane protein DUF2207